MKLPHLSVPLAPSSWDTSTDISRWDWEGVPSLPPFILADGSGLARQQTTARVCYDPQGLYVRFECDDRDIWGSFSQRDDPIYDEEVVEVFLGHGSADLIHYYEFEVSPNGVMLDARVYNPTSQRAEMEVDFGWDCPGLAWQTGRNDAASHWWAALTIPWAAVAPPGDLPRIWRGNFYRIERPRDAEPEFSGWSPTMTDPADFHKPAYFGILELEA